MLRRALAAGALALLAGCAGSPPKTGPAPATPRADATAGVPRPTHPGLTLAAVGDMMLGTDFP